MATGTELGMAVDAYERLKKDGVKARVVSMPSWELFEKQDQAYRDSVILPNVKARVTVEMGSPLGWHRYAGDHGAVLAIDRFGASAKADIVIREYGFTVENVVSLVKKQLG
jgi:transketolase